MSTPHSRDLDLLAKLLALYHRQKHLIRERTEKMLSVTPDDETAARTVLQNHANLEHEILETQYALFATILAEKTGKPLDLSPWHTTWNLEETSPVNDDK